MSNLSVGSLFAGRMLLSPQDDWVADDVQGSE